MVPICGQANVVAPVKCSKVRYPAMTSPAIQTASELRGTQFGTACRGVAPGSGGWVSIGSGSVSALAERGGGCGPPGRGAHRGGLVVCGLADGCGDGVGR